jgi:hypothetical protein
LNIDGYLVMGMLSARCVSVSSVGQHAQAGAAAAQLGQAAAAGGGAEGKEAALLSAFGVKFQPADRAKEGCKGKIEKKIVGLARVYSYSYSFRFQPWNYK